jgi:hypothetical protein
MSRISISSVQDEGMASLRRADKVPLEEEPQMAWCFEEAVPLRVAAKRVEAAERAERLRLVTGQRRAWPV